MDCVSRRARANLRQPRASSVHHSANPKHFNKNFGSCLALWDWTFGTLYVPEKTREPLTFGFPGQPDAHTVKGELGELVDPFIITAGHIWPKRPADMPALPVAERKQ